jgi:hypothetical protein
MVNQLFRSLVHCFWIRKRHCFFETETGHQSSGCSTVSFENFGNSLQLQNKVLMVLQSLK